MPSRQQLGALARLPFRLCGKIGGHLRRVRALSESGEAQIEVLARAVALAGVAAYAVGLLAVNSYLRGLGVSDFELLKPRFITTGILVILIVVLSTGAIALAALLFWEGTVQGRLYSPEGWMRMFVRVDSVLVAAMALVSPLIIYRFLVGLTWGEAASLYFVSAVLGGLLVLAWVGFDATDRAGDGNDQPDTDGSGDAPTEGGTQESRPRTWKWVFLGTLMFFLVPYFWLFMMIFSDTVYAKVPEQFGGGSPRLVRLMVSAADTPGAATIQSEAFDLGPFGILALDVSEEVELLFEGNDFLVLRRHAFGPTMRIDKKAMQGLIILSEIADPEDG